jgi:hypothetical protein
MKIDSQAFEDTLVLCPRLGARLAIGAVAGERLMPEGSHLQEALAAWVSAKTDALERPQSASESFGAVASAGTNASQPWSSIIDSTQWNDGVGDWHEPYDSTPWEPVRPRGIMPRQPGVFPNGPFGNGGGVWPGAAPNFPGFPQPGQIPPFNPGMPIGPVINPPAIGEDMADFLRKAAKNEADAAAEKESKAAENAKALASREARLAQAAAPELAQELLDAVCRRDLPAAERVLAWMRQRDLIEASRPFIEPACHIAAISRGSAEIVGRLFDHGFSAAPFRREFFPFLFACGLDPATTKKMAETLFERRCGIDPSSSSLLKRLTAVLGEETALEAQALYEKDAIAAGVSPGAPESAKTESARPAHRL